MAQQTAIEWIEERLTLSLDDEIKDLRGFFVIAKEMEKEQIKECWNTAHQAERFECKGIAEENWQTFE